MGDKILRGRGEVEGWLRCKKLQLRKSTAIWFGLLQRNSFDSSRHPSTSSSHLTSLSSPSTLHVGALGRLTALNKRANGTFSHSLAWIPALIEHFFNESRTRFENVCQLMYHSWCNLSSSTDVRSFSARMPHLFNFHINQFSNADTIICTD